MSEEELQQFEDEKQKFKNLSKVEIAKLDCVNIKTEFPQTYKEYESRAVGHLVPVDKKIDNNYKIRNKKITDEEKESIKKVIMKIRASSHFSEEDINDIDIFMQNINYYLNVSDWINNFKKEIPGTSFKTLHNFLNSIVATNDSEEIRKQLLIDKFGKKLAGNTKNIFSIVKHFIDPEKFPITFKRHLIAVELFGYEFYKNDYNKYLEFYKDKTKNIDSEKEKDFRIFMDIMYHFHELLNLNKKEIKTQQSSQKQVSTTIQNTPTKSDSQSLSKFPLNLILFGPPGTGKTYSTKLKALEIIGKEDRDNFKEYLVDFSKADDKKQIAFTTFHQSMTYEDFVEGIKPVLNEEDKNNNEGEVKYKIEPGIFKRMCERAKNNPTNNYVLIIDEINRGNVSQIFGELITLIEEDKRKGKDEEIEVTLPYSKKPFTVPNNLYIIGTMNTADRSVEALDTALRRRFVFEELPPKYELAKLETVVCGSKLSDILLTINNRIEILLDRDHLIGHSYFLDIVNKKDVKKDDYPGLFLEKMYKQIIPLLQEYFYNDYEKIGMILGEGFVGIKKRKNDFAFANNNQGTNTDFSDKVIYEINKIDVKDLQSAMNFLMKVNKDKNDNKESDKTVNENN